MMKNSIFWKFLFVWIFGKVKSYNVIENPDSTIEPNYGTNVSYWKMEKIKIINKREMKNIKK